MYLCGDEVGDKGVAGPLEFDLAVSDVDVPHALIPRMVRRCVRSPMSCSGCCVVVACPVVPRVARCPSSRARVALCVGCAAPGGCVGRVRVLWVCVRVLLGAVGRLGRVRGPRDRGAKVVVRRLQLGPNPTLAGRKVGWVGEGAQSSAGKLRRELEACVWMRFGRKWSGGPRLHGRPHCALQLPGRAYRLSTGLSRPRLTRSTI